MYYHQLQGGIYLLFCTLLASLPLLISIVYLYEFYNLRFSFLNTYDSMNEFI